ncbi:MAG: hypothetical protein Q4G19_01445 [Clostridia bacterium]|nr:hypothetical protein [Clostridia bacterium]
MKRLKVESIRTGITRSSTVCGRIGGCPVIEILVRNVRDRSVRFHSMVKRSDKLYFYENAVSLFDAFTNAELQDISFRRALSTDEKARFDSGADLFRGLEEEDKYSKEQTVIWRYMHWYAQADPLEIEKFRQRNAGKCLNDIRVPSCRAEEEYWEQREEEETWENIQEN